jgi:hypothetical protein
MRLLSYFAHRCEQRRTLEMHCVQVVFSLPRNIFFDLLQLSAKSDYDSLKNEQGLMLW